jgi:hypothetical protein
MTTIRRLGENASGVGEWVGAGAGRVRDWVRGGGRPADGDGGDGGNGGSGGATPGGSTSDPGH